MSEADIKHPQRSAPVWRGHYFSWRSYSGPFEGAILDPESAQYADLFKPYIDLAKQGVTLDRIAMQIAEDHPMRGHSVPEWNRFFGNYLRDRDLENRPVRVFMPERQERARQRRIEMATLFKRDYDSWTFTAASVAALLYEEVGSSYIRAHTFRSTIRSLSSRRIMVIGGLAFRNTTQYPPNCGLQGPVRYRRFHAKSGGLVRLLSQSRMGCAGQDRSRREADGKRGMTVMGGSPTRMRKM
jgi:hypothetical protein